MFVVFLKCFSPLKYRPCCLFYILTAESRASSFFLSLSHDFFFFPSKAFVFENSNPIDATILSARIDCSPTPSCRRSVVASRELDANRGALMSNKTAKPGWYGTYCESHPQTDLSECLSARPSPSLSASASESQTFRKVSYEIIMK